MRVFVAGHRGLVGSAVARRLSTIDGVSVTYDEDVDFLESAWAVEVLDREQRGAGIDALVIAAARVGGIGANSACQADFLAENLQIQTNLLRAASLLEIPKVVFLGSVCVYPRDAALTGPIREDQLLTGLPEPTNRGYAIAKIAGLELVRALREQYPEIAHRWVSLMPANLYGPGDNFNLQNAHAVPALLRKAMLVKQGFNREFHVWGSPDIYRELLYVDDLAEAIWRVLSKKEAPKHDLYNIGSRDGCSIGTLMQLIQKIAGIESAPVVWSGSMPAGCPRRELSSDRFISEFKYAPPTGLLAGLQKTWDWMLAHEKEMRT